MNLTKPFLCRLFPPLCRSKTCAAGSYFFLCMAFLMIAPLSFALDAPREESLPSDPGLPNALGVVLRAPPGMPESRQATFRVALEKGLRKQDRLVQSGSAANGILRVDIPFWAQETPAMGGRSDTLASLEAVVELRALPKGELKAAKRYSLRDPRLLARPDDALARLADDIVRQPPTELPPDAKQKAENVVTKTAKFVLGAAVVAGLVVLQVVMNDPTVFSRP
jgi:hypothetical protein